MFTSHTLKRLTVATLGVLLLAAAAAAPAGAVWSEPKNVSPQFIPAAEPADVEMDADGDSYFVYSAGDMLQAKKYSPTGAAVWTKSLTPRPDPNVEPPGAELPSVAVNSAGDSIYAWITSNKSGARSIVMARRLSRTGVLGQAKTIIDIGQAEGEIEAPAVGIDADGDAIVAWTQVATTVEQGQVRARALSKTDVLGATQTISTTGTGALAEFVQVGMRDNGDAVFVWQFAQRNIEGQIQMRTRLASGTLTRIRNISPFESSLPDFAMTPDGRSIVAWLYADPFAGGLNVQARTIAADGTLGKIKNLSPRGGQANDVQISLNSGGAAAAAFGITDPLTGTTQVYGRTISSTGTLSKMHALSASSQKAPTDSDVGIATSGRVVFSWLFQTATGGFRVEARTLTPTGTLGTRKVVHSGLKLFGPRLAVAPTGQAVSTWLDQEVSPVIQASFGP
jgi:hypothetical protein